LHIFIELRLWMAPNMHILGKRDQQLPQMFESTNKDGSITMKSGDTLATRCTMVNYR